MLDAFLFKPSVFESSLATVAMLVLNLMLKCMMLIRILCFAKVRGDLVKKVVIFFAISISKMMISQMWAKN